MSRAKPWRLTRYYENLTDEQIVELVHRLFRAAAESSDVEPERLRQVLVDFAVHRPPGPSRGSHEASGVALPSLTHLPAPVGAKADP